MQVDEPAVVDAAVGVAFDRYEVARRHLTKLVRPWHEALSVADEAEAERFATSSVECIRQHARFSVAVFMAHIQEVGAWLRNKPNVEVLSTADKLLTFVVSWVGILAREQDNTTPSGAAPETSKTALDGVDLSLERIYFCVIGKRLEIKGSKCPRADCGNPKMLLVSVSMRSGDEGMATIYLCAECGTLVKKIKT
jgi:DNA-directed RNA polymerase subunit M/transcription elongation factor TFIIS